MQAPPCWTEALEAAETFSDLQARNRKDGHVDAQEASIEAIAFQTEVFPAVARTADFLTYAQTAMRRGPKSPRAERLARELTR